MWFGGLSTLTFGGLSGRFNVCLLLVFSGCRDQTHVDEVLNMLIRVLDLVKSEEMDMGVSQRCSRVVC